LRKAVDRKRRHAKIDLIFFDASSTPVSNEVYPVFGKFWSRRKRMKTFLLACVSAVVLAVLAAGALNTIQEPVNEAFATTSVRL
jgi:hypothetical protein